MLADLDQRLQYGPGMRAQRIVEATFLVAAFFTADVRFAYVTLALTILQVISPRLAPVALAVAAFVPAPREHLLGDLYFDFAGTRGACAIALVLQLTALALVRSGHEAVGFVLLAMPTASLLLSPTVGFCCGCAVYVGIRQALVKLGVAKRYVDGTCDIRIDGTQTQRHQ